VSINKDIEDLNSISCSGDELRKLVRTKQTSIIKILENELKVVTKNYYRNLWLAIGMAAFGVPIGVAIGTSLGNMAFMGIGFPIGGWQLEWLSVQEWTKRHWKKEDRLTWKLNINE